MLRALVIRLGEAQAEICSGLLAEFAARPGDDDLRLEVLEAPVQAVGNLSNPVQMLREQLEDELREALTRLLALRAGGGDDFVLDVFVLMNLGEPLVANATRVVIELLDRVVERNFRAIFPPHRVGRQRRFRVIPIALLPAAQDCEKDRDDAIAELHALHAAFTEERDDGDGRFPVDRLFLLDAVTSRGIARLVDLLDQVHLFLRLVLFGGQRRLPTFVRLLESEGRDLYASFGIAACELDAAGLRQTLAKRLATEAAGALAEEVDCLLPSPAEVVPADALDDDDALELARVAVAELAVRTLEAEGFGAVRPLTQLYEALGAMLQSWAETPPSPPPSPSVDEAPAAGPGSAGLGAVVGLGSGIAMGVAAHLVALTSLGATLATGGAFGVFAFLLTWLILRRRAAPAAAEPATAAATDHAAMRVERDARIEQLRLAVDEQTTRLRGLGARFAAIAASPTADNAVEQAPPRIFRASLRSARLVELLYARGRGTPRPAELAASWLASVGDWTALLSGAARPDAASLETFCAAQFAAYPGPTLFADPDARECVTQPLLAFIEAWARGVGVSLEGESRKQFDPDGFDGVLTDAVFTPVELAATLEPLLQAHGSVARLQAAPIALNDVFVVTAATDIHHHAVAALAAIAEDR